MTVALNDIVSKAKIQLYNKGGLRWFSSELAEWGSEAQKVIVVRKPDAYVKHEAFVLVEGTLQSISGALIIFDIVRNMGTDGTTIGPAITKVDIKDMDIADPDWHEETADDEVIHWMYDDKDPSRFHVYPPQPSEGFGYVDGVWSEVPASIVEGNNITLADLYEPVILDYILFRAFSKDSFDNPDSRVMAVDAAQRFLSALGSQESAEAFYSANAPKRREK